MCERRFECAGCGFVYTTTTTKADMDDEYESRYGHKPEESEEENLSVCDYCHKLLMDKRKQLT